MEWIVEEMGIWSLKMPLTLDNSGNYITAKD